MNREVHHPNLAELGGFAREKLFALRGRWGPELWSFSWALSFEL